MNNPNFKDEHVITETSEASEADSTIKQSKKVGWFSRKMEAMFGGRKETTEAGSSNNSSSNPDTKTNDDGLTRATGKFA